jgi:hypothetical protein
MASRAVAADEVDRWPLHQSVLLVVAASGLLWVLIIAAVRWLIA